MKKSKQSANQNHSAIDVNMIQSGFKGEFLARNYHLEPNTNKAVITKRIRETIHKNQGSIKIAHTEVSYKDGPELHLPNSFSMMLEHDVQDLCKASLTEPKIFRQKGDALPLSSYPVKIWLSII
ncbi:hypothetical protein NPIL_479441 [Nephila pilipes]|uniref:Uncharacterized protein n=1 Tax=Nephila pilipes TaxID=299642 RepID=A0A8X6KC99_NEPPI|nr:hypothetical protein NPIL_479441 [Nephila pilipes]